MNAIVPDSVVLMDEEALAETVLECVDSIPWHVGKSKIARLLKGSVAQDISKMDLSHVRHYGAFENLTLAQIHAIIDQLIASGYLRSSYGRRPVILLTPEGRSAIITKDLPAIEVPDTLKMFIARERCRRCPYNPSLVACSPLSGPGPDEEGQGNDDRNGRVRVRREDQGQSQDRGQSQGQGQRQGQGQAKGFGDDCSSVHGPDAWAF